MSHFTLSELQEVHCPPTSEWFFFLPHVRCIPKSRERGMTELAHCPGFSPPNTSPHYCSQRLSKFCRTSALRLASHRVWTVLVLMMKTCASMQDRQNRDASQISWLITLTLSTLWKQVHTPNTRTPNSSILRTTILPFFLFLMFVCFFLKMFFSSWLSSSVRPRRYIHSK